MERGKLCHGGQLRRGERECRIADEDRKRHRVCRSCREGGGIVLVPHTRCRVLVQQVGSFSTGRNLLVSWTTDKIKVKSVKPFKLFDSNHQLLVFASEDEATKCDSRLPSTVLQPIDAEFVELRMCSTAKTLCPASNFADRHTKNCQVHKNNPTNNRLESLNAQHLLRRAASTPGAPKTSTSEAGEPLPLAIVSVPSHDVANLARANVVQGSVTSAAMGNHSIVSLSQLQLQPQSQPQWQPHSQPHSPLQPLRIRVYWGRLRWQHRPPQETQQRADRSHNAPFLF